MTPSEIAELSEPEARALFRHYRFLANNGEPYCNRCGCIAAWTYNDGELFKCKACLKQFTLTTNTPFAYRKAPFKTILLVIAQFAHAYQGRSALEIRADLRRKIKNYKTVFVWLHKLRLALKKHEESRMLDGEVEIDGKEMGGYIRPKNARKDKKDYWKFPYRAADRKLWVTFARARTGAARAYVCRREEDAVDSFMTCLRPGTVVYADMGKWSPVRDQFDLRQVNHSTHFYTAESCTNNAESGHNALGTMERIYRHITNNYLDSYAAQLAWRMTSVRRDRDANFADLMGAVIAGGRSPMTGYFLPKSKGGRKRYCEIVNPDGSVGYWRPPSSEERRKARRAASSLPRTPILKDARSAARWMEGFSFIPAAAFLSDPKVIPTSPGVYALFLRSGPQLLESVGYSPDPGLPLWTVNGRAHLYTGECIGLRKRVTEHLLGDIEASTFRGTLLALHWEAGMRIAEAPDFAERQPTESALTEWLSDEVIIGYKPCGYTRAHQNALLQRTASPLNISDREPTAFTHLLRRFRQAFEEAVIRDWAPPPAIVRPRHRR